MRNASTVTGVLGLAIAILAWIEARTFPLQDLQSGLGAAFFPLLVLGAIVVLSIMSIFAGRASSETLENDLTFHDGTPKALLLLLLLVVFAFAFGHFGLLVPAIVFLSLVTFILGAPWLPALLAGAVSGAAVYALFTLVLRVPLP